MAILYRCWAEVDLDALRENLVWIKHRVGRDTKILTVVKADAYGHGLKQIAALLMQSGTDIFGVANLTEAQSVRSVGIGWPILMLGSCLPHEVESAVRDEIMPTLSSLEEAKRFAEAAKKTGKTVHAHLKVDTGMGRLGVAAEQAVALVKKVSRLKNLQLTGLMTHFSSAEDDLDFSERQRERFHGVLQELETAGIHPPLVHASNSAAVLYEPEAWFNVVRPGLMVYGVLPPGQRKTSTLLQKHLRPALSWKARVSLVKDLPAGASVSYGRTFVTPARMRVAIVTAGYGDGFLRAASNQACVLIRGKRCRILGRVTMDQMIVDITALKNVASGDETVLIGRQGHEEITATDLAGWCDTIPWEILTNITYRVPRIYKGSYAA
jgi:alanine racemase